MVEKPRERSSISKLSRSGVEETREGSKVSVSWLKTRERSSILKLSRAGVGKTREGSSILIYPGPSSKKRARGRPF